MRLWWLEHELVQMEWREQEIRKDIARWRQMRHDLQIEIFNMEQS